MKNLNKLQTANKAYVPVAVGVLLLLLSQVGITAEMSVEELLTYVVASIGVYLIPNKESK